MSDSEIEGKVVTSGPEEGEVTNMFASVWVKVEVEGDTETDADSPSSKPRYVSGPNNYCIREEIL